MSPFQLRVLNSYLVGPPTSMDARSQQSSRASIAFTDEDRAHVRALISKYDPHTIQEAFTQEYEEMSM